MFEHVLKKVTSGELLTAEESGTFIAEFLRVVAGQCGVSTDALESILLINGDGNYDICDFEYPTARKIAAWMKSLPWVPQPGDIVDYQGKRGTLLTSPNFRLADILFDSTTTLRVPIKEVTFVAPAFPYTLENTEVRCHFERDRAQVSLIANKEFLITYWDGAYFEAVEDGFISGSVGSERHHLSLLEQYRHHYPSKNLDIKEVLDV